MNDDCPNCDVAERQLDRVQAFFPRIDAKLSALFAISSAQIAVAALNVGPDDFKLWFVAIPAVVFALMALSVLINLYRCAFPHLEGGNNSLIYFVEIAKHTESNYIKSFSAYVASDRLADLTGQIWRNSQIASLKYGYLKTATSLSMFSIIPWAAMLLATSLTHWRGPILG